MPLDRWISRSVVAIVAALALTACPSMGPRTPPPTEARAETLTRSGDHAGAAHVYEALAANSRDEIRNEYLLRAVESFLAGRRPDEASRVLAKLQAPLTRQHAFEQQLLTVQVLMARGQAQQAWQRMLAMSEPSEPREAARFLQVKQRTAFAAGQLVEGVRAHIARERLLTTPDQRNEARVQLLGALRDASERGVRIDPRSSQDPTVRGWLELAPLAAAAARNPTMAIPEIQSWRARNPNHPAQGVVSTELLGLEPRFTDGAGHVALLLPLSGRQASAAMTVRDGFMTAFYQTPPTQRPRVRIYDTAEASAAETILRATQEGAELIVGPLLREEVIAAADLAVPRPAILALNFLPADRPAPNAFYQFALSPEDEARAVAKRILADGHRHGIALVPTGDWGSRVLAAFTQELTAGGGDLIGSATLDPAIADYAQEITGVLGLADSRARHRRLESVLGTKLQFEPRRRGDIEFIFAASQVGMARLLRPQLRFHYAGAIPTYATSDAYEPDPRANEDIEGLIFPDMPWMLGGPLADSVRTETYAAWPSGGPRRNRLFAFGFDAYQLAEALRSGSLPSRIEGLTGRLSFDADRRVRRELDWARIQNGQPQPLLPAFSHSALD